MPMHLRLCAILTLVLAQPVAAEPAGCPMLIAALEGATGLALSAPPAPDVAGWCVLDGFRSSGDSAVRVSAEVLRLRGETVGDGLVALEVEAAGLRVTPALGNRDMPDWLRDLLRLQSAELRVDLRRDEDENLLVLDLAQLRLSGGGELLLKGKIAGAELSAPSLLTGRLTELYLEWQNDGRTLRPILEAWGARLQPGATGTEAVLAARSKLESIVAAMPEGSQLDGLPDGVDGFIAALPQGRGRLLMVAGSDNGIGAVELGRLALAKDPTGPEALARFFAGTRVSIAWTAGLNP
jgi:hypothetical protein